MSQKLRIVPDDAGIGWGAVAIQRRVKGQPWITIGYYASAAQAQADIPEAKIRDRKLKAALEAR